MIGPEDPRQPLSVDTYHVPAVILKALGLGLLLVAWHYLVASGVWWVDSVTFLSFGCLSGVVVSWAGQWGDRGAATRTAFTGVAVCAILLAITYIIHFQFLYLASLSEGSGFAASLSLAWRNGLTSLRYDPLGLPFRLGPIAIALSAVVVGGRVHPRNLKWQVLTSSALALPCTAALLLLLTNGQRAISLESGFAPTLPSMRSTLPSWILDGWFRGLATGLALSVIAPVMLRSVDLLLSSKDAQSQ